MKLSFDQLLRMYRDENAENPMIEPKNRTGKTEDEDLLDDIYKANEGRFISYSPAEIYDAGGGTINKLYDANHKAIKFDRFYMECDKGTVIYDANDNRITEIYNAVGDPIGRDNLSEYLSNKSKTHIIGAYQGQGSSSETFKRACRYKLHDGKHAFYKGIEFEAVEMFLYYLEREKGMRTVSYAIGTNGRWEFPIGSEGNADVIYHYLEDPENFEDIISPVFTLSSVVKSQILRFALKIGEQWLNSRDYAERNRNTVEAFLQRTTGWRFRFEDGFYRFYDFLKELIRYDSNLGYPVINAAIDKKINSRNEDKSAKPNISLEMARKHRVGTGTSYLQVQTEIIITQHTANTEGKDTSAQGRSVKKGHIAIKEIKIYESMDEIIDSITGILADATKNSNITVEDAVRCLGNYALLCSSNLGCSSAGEYPKSVGHCDNEEYPQEMFTCWEPYKRKEDMDVIKLAATAGIIHRKGDGSMEFTKKLHRILLSAIFHAKISNEATRDVYVPTDEGMFDGKYDALMQTYNFEDYPSDQGDEEVQKLSHVDVTYHWASLYFMTFLRYSHDRVRTKFIERLCCYAKDFRTSKVSINGKDKHRRYLQIKALSILSYYLYYNSTKLTSAEESRLFHICFSQTLYKEQAVLASTFMKERKFYNDFVQTEFQRNLVITDGYAKGQPYYYLLQGEDFEKNVLMDTPEVETSKGADFFYQSVRYLRRTWDKADDVVTFTKADGKELQNIISTIIEIGSHVKSTLIDFCGEKRQEQYTNSYILWEAYGIQAYALAFANILLENSKRSEKLKDALDDEKLQKIMSAFIYADYITRKTNRLYFEGNYRNGDDFSDAPMYMLWGSLRFFCQFQEKTPAVIFDRKIEQRMKQDYSNWIAVESIKNARYSFTMLMMLAHTDMNLFSLFDIDMKCCYEKVVFLKYDQMPETYTEFEQRIRTMSAYDSEQAIVEKEREEDMRNAMEVIKGMNTQDYNETISYIYSKWNH